MPSKGGLIFHLNCLMYVPYLGNFETLKITNSTINEHLVTINVYQLTRLCVRMWSTCDPRHGVAASHKR